MLPTATRLTPCAVRSQSGTLRKCHSADRPASRPAGRPGRPGGGPSQRHAPPRHAPSDTNNSNHCQGFENPTAVTEGSPDWMTLSYLRPGRSPAPAIPARALPCPALPSPAPPCLYPVPSPEPRVPEPEPSMAGAAHVMKTKVIISFCQISLPRTMKFLFELTVYHGTQFKILPSIYDPFGVYF